MRTPATFLFIFLLTIVSIEINIYLFSFPSQQTEIKLSKGKLEEEIVGDGPPIQYKIRHIGMYVVVDSVIGLSVLWDNKTAVRILLEPQHSVSHMNCSCLKSFTLKVLDDYWNNTHNHL